MPMRTLSVMQAKRFGVWAISRDANLKAVARELVDRNISCLVVADEDGYLEGLITRTDLVRAAYESSDWMQQTGDDYIVRNVVTVRLEDHLERVMELLIEHHVHRVVAVEPENVRQAGAAQL